MTFHKKIDNYFKFLTSFIFTRAVNLTCDRFREANSWQYRILNILGNSLFCRADLLGSKGIGAKDFCMHFHALVMKYVSMPLK